MCHRAGRMVPSLLGQFSGTLRSDFNIAASGLVPQTEVSIQNLDLRMLGLITPSMSIFDMRRK